MYGSVLNNTAKNAHSSINIGPTSHAAGILATKQVTINGKDFSCPQASVALRNDDL